MKANRGEELPGMTNPAILKPLMRKQTSKWEELAASHFKYISSTTTEVAVKILYTVCAEQRIPNNTRHGLENLIREGFGAASERQTLKTISEMCHRRATGLLQTNNQSFLEKVRKSRKVRFEAALERYRTARPASNFFSIEKFHAHIPDLSAHVERLAIIRQDTIQQLFDELHPSQQKNTEDEIHDLLKAYYEVRALSPYSSTNARRGIHIFRTANLARFTGNIFLVIEIEWLSLYRGRGTLPHPSAALSISSQVVGE